MKYIGKTFWFFFTHYPQRTISVVLLLIVVGAMEGLSIAAFLPFLQIFLDGREQLDNIPFAPLDAIVKAMGIRLNFVNMGLIIATILTAKAAVLWLAMYKVSKTVSLIATDFRDRFLRSLLVADWRYFVGHALGRSLNSIATETFRGSLTFVSITRLLAYCIQFSVYLAGAFIISWQISLGIIAVGAASALTLWVFVRIARRAGVHQTETIKAMLGQMGDVLQGIKPLRAMALENKFLEVLQGYSKTLEKAQVDQLLSAQSLRIFHEPLMAISAILGLFVAMHLGALEGSALILMMILFVRIMTGLNSAQSEYQRLTQEESALWSLMETIHEIENRAESDTGVNASPDEITNICFKDVSFSHGDKKVLHAVNLEFPVRQLSILIGESGSGKTTILDLLCCLLKPSSGHILVNDEDLNKFSQKSWRKKIGFVPQEVFLFNDSIFNNIVMGRQDISENDVWAALESVGAEDFVRALPQGIHAPVGENGRMLSGGQRQRISIARAIAGRPQILLLDEATSALDRETEKVLLKTLKSLAQTMSVILVTHNPSAIAYADRIYEMKNHRVLEAITP